MRLQKGWLACHGEKACPFWPPGKETKQKGDIRRVWVDISAFLPGGMQQAEMGGNGGRRACRAQLLLQKQ